MSWRDTCSAITMLRDMSRRYRHFRTTPENGNYIVVDDSRYFLDFDEDGHLNRIRLQEGGSRRLQFEMGMTMEEVRSKIDGGLDFVFESADRPDKLSGVTNFSNTEWIGI